MTAPPPTRTVGTVQAGDRLPDLTIPITPTLIVAGAIASRDFQDVHHDRDLAQKRGSPDIFMNILTSNGLVGRYISDWAGPDALIKRVAIRLGAPNYPYDTMTITGTVESSDPSGRVVVRVVGRNGRGDHLSGVVDVQLPMDGRS